MEIADIGAYALSSPIDPPQDRRFHGGTRTLHKRDFVLIVVETPDGERGFAPGGASSSAMREHFDDASQERFASLIEGPVADALVGSQLYTAGAARKIVSGLDLPPLLESQVLGSIDVALHDIQGKRHGAPVYELLANERPVSTELPLYASGGMYMPPEGYAEQAATLRDLGFFGYKYRPGIGPAGDIETIELLAETVGDDMEIMVDAHTWWKLGDRSYSTAERRSVVEAYEEHDVFWLEEPVAPDDYEGYAELAEESVVPLAGGESEESVRGLRTLARSGGVDFLQGDVRHHGGFTGCSSVVEFCDGMDVQFVPHNFGTLLGLVANAHLVATVPGEQLLEYPVFENDPHLDASDDPGMYPFDLAFDVLNHDLAVEDGHLTVPSGDGLGVDVDMDVIEEYPHRDGAWTTFEYE